MTYSNFSDQIKSELDNYIFYTKVTADDIATAYKLYKNNSITAIQSINKVLKSKK